MKVYVTLGGTLVENHWFRGNRSDKVELVKKTSYGEITPGKFFSEKITGLRNFS